MLGLSVALVWPSLGCRAQAQAQASVPSAETRPIVDKLRSDADALSSLVTTELARDFLAATRRLLEPKTRTVYRDKAKNIAVSSRAFDRLSEEKKISLKPRECTPEFYYETAYGSPLVYARLLDLAASHLALQKTPKVLDFGYGTIGHLQLLAHCGFEAHGVDVEPLLAALYSEPGDVGAIGSGFVSIHTGHWPAEEALREAVGRGFDLITSKNTLKSGYLHPSPLPGQSVDPKRLLQLGVGDEEFLERVHDALRPGGVFLLYNIAPPQNPSGKEYIPHADGKTPFPRAMFEAKGFEVIAFDGDDQPWVLESFERLGYSEGRGRDEMTRSFFAWYTIAQKKP